MNTLEQIFAETFVNGGPVEKMRYQDTDGWDSLQHMVLISRIEDNFDIMLEINDIAAMSSFEAAQTIVNRILNNG